MKKPCKLIYVEWKFNANMLESKVLKIEFENPIRRLSFLCHLMDITIAWINPRLRSAVESSIISIDSSITDNMIKKFINVNV